MSFFNRQLKAGDHLITERLGYTHHGIYLGKNKVIHYSGLAAGLRAGPVEVTDLIVFSQGKSTYVQQHESRKFSHRQTIKRARSRLSEDKYNLLLNNCEHFINWCIYGKASSPQVTNVVKYALSITMMNNTLSSMSVVGLGLKAIGKRW
ncbi:cell wall-associated hydrolase [Psychrobacter sp. JCM 18903]|uniref:lecithin retinol acyltransferase family protein n=1 Tax=Psychrobacter sp. JCM 18903 TaxID=1298610 RepID=UPI000433ACBE|nr:lecithin retinol acyltransferase family protein [Psychrobacter sp. JCM 18903]GAF63064.1 cell wall-associated hydrolase [Psychrobacter sp. JCM 18903]